MSETPVTFHAPATTSKAAEIARQVKVARSLAIVRELLGLVPDLLMVINANRQIIFANNVLLDTLKVDPYEAIGMRLGEVIGCAKLPETPTGCGTGEECRRCSGLAAMLAGLKGHNVEREAHFDLADGKTLDVRVKAHPIDWAGERFVGFSLTDISDEVRRRELERSFFKGLSEKAELLASLESVLTTISDDEKKELQALLTQATEALRADFAVQDALPSSGMEHVEPEWHSHAVGDIVNAVIASVRSRMQLRGLGLDVQSEHESDQLETDKALLVGSLGSLFRYVIEMAAFGDDISAGVETNLNTVGFWISHRGYIPLGEQERVFAPKTAALEFGPLHPVREVIERKLDGVVSFRSDPERGTKFQVTVPRHRGASHLL